jgi:hypothetical protein
MSYNNDGGEAFGHWLARIGAAIIVILTLIYGK